MRTNQEPPGAAVVGEGAPILAWPRLPLWSLRNGEDCAGRHLRRRPDGRPADGCDCELLARREGARPGRVQHWHFALHSRALVASVERRALGDGGQYRRREKGG